MNCGTCGTALDVRAPLVRVVGGRVVAFCSMPCFEGIEPEPASLGEPPPSKVGGPLAAAKRQPRQELATAGSDAALAAGPAVFPLPDEAVAWSDAAPAAGPAVFPLPDEIPPRVPVAPISRRRPLAWGVAVNLGGVTLAVALMGLLWQTVPSQPETAAALPKAAPRPPEPPRPSLVERARGVLDEHLTDDDDSLAFQAADALARLGDPRGQKILRRTLSEEENPRRMLAAKRLAEGGDEEAIALLRDRLSSRYREERLDAAQALAHVGDASGKDGLRALVNRRRTRAAAASALAALGDERALALLRSQLESDNIGTRARAAMALGRRGDPAAASELRRLLEDPRTEVGAAIALSYLSDPAARPGLEASLAHSAIRVEAAEALVRLGGSPNEALVAALDEEPPSGRISAALAILVLLAGEGEGR